MTKHNLSKKDVLTITALAVVVAVIITLVIFNWQTCEKLLDNMLSGTEVAKEFVQSLRFFGVLMMALALMLCFFVPVLPAWVLQVAAGVAYGVVCGTLFAVLASWLASQLLWLFRKNVLIFSGKNAKAKSEAMKKQIQNSKLGIHRAMIIAYCVPFIPYLLVSSLGVEGLSYKQYVLYTFVGPIGSTLVTILLGRAMLASSPVWSAVTVIALICLVVLSFVFKQRILNLLFRPKTETPQTEN